MVRELTRLFRSRLLRRPACYALLASAATLCCTPAAFINNTTTLGGTTPGSRGNISIAFINRTPFRAIFTYGVYDPQNPQFRPEFGQFAAGPDSTTRLEGNSESDTITFTCGRAISVGGDRLIQLIRDQNLVGDSDPAALQPGIAFSDQPLDSEDADQPTAGRATGVVTLQGVEFQCDSLVVYTFELDEESEDGFRISYEVLLP